MTGFFGRSRQRWPAIALVASLLLNGFLVGMLIVDQLRPHRGFTGSRVVGFELRRLADRLPEDAVEGISAGLQPLAAEMEGHIERLRALRAEIRRIAAEPAPDRAAIDGRLAALRTEASAMQEAVQRATYDAVLELPAETRAGLAVDPPGG